MTNNIEPASNRGRSIAQRVAVLAFAGAVAFIGFSTGPKLLAANNVNSPVTKVNFTAGTFHIELKPGAASKAVSEVPPIAPGDTMVNFFDVTNVSEVAMDKLEVSGSYTGDLFTGPNPATVALDGCTAPYDEKGACSGESFPVSQQASSATLTRLVAPHGRLYLKSSTSLPSAADNEYAGRSGSSTYTFTGTQQAQENTLPTPESN